MKRTRRILLLGAVVAGIAAVGHLAPRAHQLVTPVKSQPISRVSIRYRACVANRCWLEPSTHKGPSR